MNLLSFILLLSNLFVTEHLGIEKLSNQIIIENNKIVVSSNTNLSPETTNNVNSLVSLLEKQPVNIYCR